MEKLLKGIKMGVHVWSRNVKEPKTSVRLPKELLANIYDLFDWLSFWKSCTCILVDINIDVLRGIENSYKQSTKLMFFIEVRSKPIALYVIITKYL